MAQFSKKVLATWAVVVVAEEIDLNLDEQHAEVPDLDDMDLDEEEDLGMNLGADADADPMGGLGGLFGAMGGEPSEETKQIFATHDTNGDGKLDAEEFGDFLGETMWEMSADQRGGKEYIEVGNATGEEELGMKEMDKNGDGKITKEEYKSGVGAAPGDGFLEMLDSNKSGGLEIEEFGFVVNMFNMSKGGHEGHDHAHGDDHSCCGGHHHEQEPETAPSDEQEPETAPSDEQEPETTPWHEVCDTCPVDATECSCAKEEL